MSGGKLFKSLETESAFSTRASSPQAPRPAALIASKLLRLTPALAVVGAALVIGAGLSNHFLLDGGVFDLNPESEGNLLAWLSVVSIFTGALATALHAVMIRRSRRAFAALAAIFAFLSLDEMTKIHERVSERLALSTFDHVETLVFLPIYVTAFMLIWSLSREAPLCAGRFLRVGAGLLVVAVVVDVAGTWTRALEADGIAWPHPVRVAIEEGLELAGWILISASFTAIVWLALAVGAEKFGTTASVAPAG